MMLLDTDLLWPVGADASEIEKRVEACLDNADANRDVWDDPRFHYPSFITRVCLEYGVHPAWVLTSFQRERGLLGSKGTVRDWEFANGVVGKDGPGTVNNLWNGLPTQIFLSVRTFAWLARVGPIPYRPGLIPQAKRYYPGDANAVQLLDSAHNAVGFHEAECPTEYAQLMFTPHLEVLSDNFLEHKKWVLPFFS